MFFQLSAAGQRSPPLRIQWHRWLHLRPSHQRRHVPLLDLPEARQDSQPPMDRTAAAPAASDEVVKKYTRELTQNSCVQTILVPTDSGCGNGPSVPQIQQQQQSPSTIPTVTQQYLCFSIQS